MLTGCAAVLAMSVMCCTLPNAEQPNHLAGPLGPCKLPLQQILQIGICSLSQQMWGRGILPQRDNKWVLRHLQDNSDATTNLFGPPLYFTAGKTHHLVLKNELTIPYDETEVSWTSFWQGCTTQRSKQVKDEPVHAECCK